MIGAVNRPALAGDSPQNRQDDAAFYVTFGDVTVDADGRLLSQAQVIRDVIAEAELADSLGVDFFGVGEHHRADFAISAPEVIRRHRRPHHAHATHVRGDGAQLR